MMHLEVPNGVCELKANFHVQEMASNIKWHQKKAKTYGG